MPRQARIVFSGELYHITQRGNFRQKVFFDDQDRATYLKYIEENASKHDLRIYAYCLMDNHVHFIVKPENDKALADVFRITHQRYSLYLNKRLKQFGHRWQSRFYSCLLLGDYIQKAVRYVEKNPVRAGMFKKPWHYAWSSARAHLGESYKIITLADINEYIQVASWKEYLCKEEGLHEIKDLRTATQQGKAFGLKQDVEDVETKTGQQLMARNRGRPYKDK